MSAVRQESRTSARLRRAVRRRRLAQFGEEPLFLPLYRRDGQKRTVESSGRYQMPGIHLLQTRAAYSA
jgi:hypothetical protein